MVDFNEEKQIKRLEELKKKEEEDLAEILSSRYGVQYINLLVVSINTDALKLIPEEESRRNKLAVFDMLGNRLKVAVKSPNNPDTQASIAQLNKTGYETTIFMVSDQSLEKAWDRYKDISYSVKTEEGMLSISGDVVKQFIDEAKNITDVKNSLKEILEKETVNRVSKFFDMILAGALSLEASDIHIEPEESFIRLRYRLDGILTNIIEFDEHTYNLIASRTKLISGLKLNIKDNAQDGRFSIKISDLEIEIRTSTMPGAYGESIVLRILNPKTISVPMEELGIEPNLLKILEKEIKKPNGMLLNTGPTGSGKTTTLYAFLKKVYNPGIKIITIEDPIEYHLPGISQTQTEKEKGYTFASGLKSALRQDPDVIMVGEIRDSETAEIAVNSALTGHLVLSTLHTNTAAGTFPRLVELGVNTGIMGSSINVSMAQRLIRKLCSQCKKEVVIEGESKKIIDDTLAGIKDIEKYEIKSRDKMFVAVGCEKCNETGYKGRIGIFEAILMDEEIEDLIRMNPSEREIQKVAKEKGLLDMNQDGIIKVLNGVTSLDELERVIEF